MKKGVLADTGPLFAALDPSDAHHNRAHRELRRLNREEREITITYPTLLETYSLTLFRLGIDAALRCLGEIDAALFINPTPDDYRQATNKIRRFSDQPITLTDATVAVVASRLNLDVWTYDHHFDVMQVPVWR